MTSALRQARGLPTAKSFDPHPIRRGRRAAELSGRRGHRLGASSRCGRHGHQCSGNPWNPHPGDRLGDRHCGILPRARGQNEIRRHAVLRYEGHRLGQPHRGRPRPRSLRRLLDHVRRRCPKVHRRSRKNDSRTRSTDRSPTPTVRRLLSRRPPCQRQNGRSRRMDHGRSDRPSLSEVCGVA
jgi:hypothetical protein